MSVSDILQNQSDWPDGSCRVTKALGEVTLLRILYGANNAKVKKFLSYVLSELLH